MKRAHRHLLWISLALLASACGLFSKKPAPPAPPNRLQGIAVQAEAGANRDSSTALDVAFVYEAAAEAQLPQDAVQWFAQRAALQARLGSALDVVSVEIPPDFHVAALALPKRSGEALVIFAFANYLSAAGRHPINLTAYQRVRLRLQADTVLALEEEPS